MEKMDGAGLQRVPQQISHFFCKMSVIAHQLFFKSPVNFNDGSFQGNSKNCLKYLFLIIPFCIQFNGCL